MVVKLSCANGQLVLDAVYCITNIYKELCLSTIIKCFHEAFNLQKKGSKESVTKYTEVQDQLREANLEEMIE